MLESCTRPEMVVEITLQPVRRHGVDAAILYSDIVVPLKAIGVDLDIVPGTGPVVAEPVRGPRPTCRPAPARSPTTSRTSPTPSRRWPASWADTPLIGFAGAPFTLASYLVEGGPSRDHARTKALMRADPDLWHDLLGRLATIAGEFLRLQVQAGASAVQLFDSWAGTLSVADYERYCQPHSAAVLAAVADLGVPRIHFGVGTGELLAAMGEAGADVVGVDWRVPLDAASTRVGPDRALQGNLDPAVAMAPWPAVDEAVRDVLRAGSAAPGPRVQPGPRGAAGHRPRRAHPHRRAGAPAHCGPAARRRRLRADPAPVPRAAPAGRAGRRAAAKGRTAPTTVLAPT